MEVASLARAANRKCNQEHSKHAPLPTKSLPIAVIPDFFGRTAVIVCPKSSSTNQELRAVSSVGKVSSRTSMSPIAWPHDDKQSDGNIATTPMDLPKDQSKIDRRVVSCATNEDGDIKVNDVSIYRHLSDLNIVMCFHL